MRAFKILIILFITLFLSKDSFSQAYFWNALNSGINGKVRAITIFNDNVIAGGGFTLAGGAAVSNIASWNGSSWTALSNGLNDTVYALGVYNNKLIAAGRFTQSGSTSLLRIAQWDGTSWAPLGTGLDDEARALTVFNSELIVGGNFGNAGGINADNIAKWNGTTWSALGTGLTGSGDEVFTLTVFNSELVAGGRFEIAGGIPVSNVAKWNGSAWSSLGTGLTNDRVFALTVNNSQLYAGGKFTIIMNTPANHIASWNGVNWSAFGNGVDDDVNSLVSFNNELIVGGNFKYAGNGNFYTDRLVKWNGSSWSRIIAGSNEKTYALATDGYSLYAGGEFTVVGGIYANKIARCGNQITSTISGSVKYADNNAPVLNGSVKALRLDPYTREVITVDSGNVINGDYILPNVIKDTLFVIIFPDDELIDYVPTYYPSNIDWQSAVKVVPATNLTNININVYRITQQSGENLSNISGAVHLNYLPPLAPIAGLPFKSDAIVYARQGNLFRNFSISRNDESYTVTNLASGTYQIYVNRLGYTSDEQTIIVNNTNIDSVNFLLDTLNNPIGIKNISNEIVKDFKLFQNYPNPFNPVTTINFQLSQIGSVRLTIYDALGREIEKLVNEDLAAGKYQITWDAAEYPSGIYFYTLETDNLRETRKMILIK